MKLFILHIGLIKTTFKMVWDDEEISTLDCKYNHKGNEHFIADVRTVKKNVFLRSCSTSFSDDFILKYMYSCPDVMFVELQI